jgi:endo-1,4-beta-xylanase
VDDLQPLTRRRLVLGLAGAATIAVASSCSRDGSADTAPSATPTPTPSPPAGATTSAGPTATSTPLATPSAEVRLATCAARNGLEFGTSAATWQLADAGYARLVDAQADVVLTEDDLLWYRLRPAPGADLDFSHADEFFRRAERHDQRVVGAHLVWDEGFGDGWSTAALAGLSRRRAHALLFDTLEATVKRYRHRAAAWIVANEVTAPDGNHGLRTDVPWYTALGADYVAEAFHRARDQDDAAVLILNDYGFETVDEDGNDPVERQRAFLQVLDSLIATAAPVDAVGVQAHLLADDFASRFETGKYTRFLAAVADRGVSILITELDVQDDGLPADAAARDRAVADVYRRYLDVALQEGAVKAVITFGLSDRYTWLEEDYPRSDGALRRPLLYDGDVRAKPARAAVQRSLTGARHRTPLWR